MYHFLIEPLIPWKFWIDFAAAVCAFAAATFWLWASFIKAILPEQKLDLSPVGLQPHDFAGFAGSLEKQSRLNAKAAMFAAAAAILTGISVLIGTRWD